MDPRTDGLRDLPPQEPWRAWPVSWSAVWVGTLTALAVLVLIGLIGVAVGAHLTGPAHRIVHWKDVGLLTLIFSIAGAFFAFVAGGWVAGRVGGFLQAEPAMLHGAIAWLVAIPLLMVATAFGASSYVGAWYGGLAGTPSWTAVPVSARVLATSADDTAKQAAEDEARATRNGALGALTALLLGLLGSVIGGWMASGEPMSFAHYRHVPDPVTRHSA